MLNKSTSRLVNMKSVLGGLAVVAVLAVIGVGGYFVFGYIQERQWAKSGSCEELRTEEETRRLLLENQTLVQQIYDAGASMIDIQLRDDCGGKAEIIIQHGTVSQARAIRQAVGETFQGVPYRLVHGETQVSPSAPSSL